MNSKEIWKVYGNVFSQFSLRNLDKLSRQGYFADLKKPVATGKESNIFTASTEDGDIRIIKMYRLENCNFNKMWDYISQDMRYISLKKSKREVVFSWTQREYRNLLKAREVIRVPTPYVCKDNIIIMEAIGNLAPQLKNSIPEDVPSFFKKVVANMKKLHKAGIVHGDLSAFNILNDRDEPVFIDFSQSTTTESGNAVELLRRDVKNICQFFGKYIDVDEESVLKQIVK